MAAPIGQKLLAVLKKVERPGTFCVSGDLPATLPGLSVAGVGRIALPLTGGKAATLKKVARRAPYGMGTRTIVDTDVRRVWEIDAARVVLANPAWSGVVDQAVRATQTALGLDKQQLDAHLYKLLLYEPGGFFLPHRDGERLDRMVATLVITLPSAHRGGELVVRHEGREEVIDFAPASAFETQFAAFYADCEHEVRPVKSGHRLALVYNLTLRKSKKAITAPLTGGHVAAAGGILQKWSREAGPSKLAVLLEYQYTEAGLKRDALKGLDRAKADVLFAAARDAGCEAFLALVTYWVSGAAEYDDDDDYGYDRYADDEDEDDASEYVMGEVFDSSLSAAHFSDADGNPLDFGSIPLNEDEEIVSKQPLGEGKPDKEDYEGYTGNEGMTLDRWYHRAAVVVWRAASHFDVLCQAGTTAAVGGLAQMVARLNRAPAGERDDLKQRCLAFAARIIANWPEREYAHEPSWSRYDIDDTNAAAASKTTLLPLLAKLDEPAIVSAYVRQVLGRDVSEDPGKALGNLCKRYGWPTYQADLLRLFKSTSDETIQRHARLLADLALRKDEDAGRITLCTKLAREMMSTVERWNPARPDRLWHATGVDPRKLLPPLIQSFVALDQPGLLDRLVTYVLGRPKELDLTTVQVPVLLDLSSRLTRAVDGRCPPPLRRWLDAIRRTLESRAASPPREPTDWRRASATGCGCAECREVQQFLDDPTRQTLRLPLAEPRRKHLHNVIDHRRLDTTHVTERRGRPYTLVCTKTTASYQRALQAHRTDLDQLAKVRTLIDSMR